MNYYLGEIIAFAGYYVPQDFQLCDGSSLKISDYQQLYSVIGTTFGGDGIANFNVPDLRGLVVVGTGMSSVNTPYNLGAKGGQTQVSITTNQMPPHNHAMQASTANATTSDPTNAVLAASVPGAQPTQYTEAKIYGTGTTPNATLNAGSVLSTGNNQPHNNQQPYVTIAYMICTNGFYPVPQ